MSTKDKCSGEECQINVTVNDCAKGDITVDRPIVVIDRQKHIKWSTLVGKDKQIYVFTSTGIQIAGADFVPAPGLGSTGRDWRLFDSYSANIGVPIKYAIEVAPAAGGAPCKLLDPYIFNE